MGWRRAAPDVQPAPRPERPPVFMATVDTLPQHHYEIVGLVHASEPIAAGSAPMSVLLDALADQAAAMDADAVIGIRISEVSMPGMSRERLLGRVTDHYGGVVVATALGTAVRLRPPAHHGARLSGVRSRAR
jgi:hypothetical protein